MLCRTWSAANSAAYGSSPFGIEGGVQELLTVLVTIRHRHLDVLFEPIAHLERLHARDNLLPRPDTWLRARR